MSGKKGRYRYFIEIAYNGVNYHGWQMQTNSISVQHVLEDCLSKKLGHPVRSHGCGRTDAGVHATQFFVHFDSDMELQPSFINEFNLFLPKDIAVRNLFLSNDKPDGYPLHARFDAFERQYTYYLAKRKDPFGIGLVSSLFTVPLSIYLMNQACALLPQYQDFRTFTKLSAQKDNNICDLKWAKWEENEDHFIFSIASNRFLRSMVRKIVGAMVWVGAEKMSIRQFMEAIESGDPTRSGPTAPPDGLYLVAVKYPEGSLIPIQ